MGQLFELASQGLGIRAGDVRLVGWTDQPMPALEISPPSAQAVRRTLILVHLQRGSLPVPRRDNNCKADVVDIVERDPLQENADEAQDEEAIEPQSGASQS